VTIPTQCPHCGSRSILEVADPGKRHYAQLICGACSRWIRWIPKPPPTIGTADLRPPEPLPKGAALPSLKGTPKQVKFAESVRRDTLRRVWSAGHKDLARSMATIADAGWWLSNRDRPLESVHFPSDWRPPPLPFIDLTDPPPASSGLAWFDFGDGTGAWTMTPEFVATAEAAAIADRPRAKVVKLPAAEKSEAEGFAFKEAV
jgi:hypothetical protein